MSPPLTAFVLFQYSTYAIKTILTLGQFAPSRVDRKNDVIAPPTFGGVASLREAISSQMANSCLSVIYGTEIVSYTFYTHSLFEILWG